METSHEIICPRCGLKLNVNEILYRQLENQYKKDFESKYEELINQYNKKEEELTRQKKALEDEKRMIDERVAAEINERLIAEKKQQEEKIRKKIEEEEREKYLLLQKELNEKSEKIKEMNRLFAENEKLRREKEELKTDMEANFEIRLNELLKQEREKIAAQNELKIRELEKKLADQIELTKEMAKKQEQGSVQLQGEAQELAIEEWLKSNFPLDTIEEISKGARGADCIQIVNTSYRRECGKIYYESKRAKEFKKEWIEKFKVDMREKNIRTGVLVTQVLPANMERMGLKDGVWICTYNEFKGLCTVLRETIIMISDIVESQENKGGKMEMLYNYLTSADFRSQIEAIVEGFTEMKNELNKERMAMERIWKTREKQIEKVLLNTVHMYASIKGIAGISVPSLKALELDEGTDEKTAQQPDEN